MLDRRRDLDLRGQDPFDALPDQIGGLAVGAARVRVWAGEHDQGDGVLIGLADLLVTSAAIIDEARDFGSKDLRAISTLIRAHREVLAEIAGHVPTVDPPDEFAAFLDDLKSA
jgi:hypothetical protein